MKHSLPTRAAALFLVSILSLPLTNHAQGQEELAVSALKEDFALLRQALEEAHPGLYRYTSESAFDSVFSNTEKRIDHSMTQQEFYALLLPVVGQIKCGHTKLHPENLVPSHFYFNTEHVFPWRLNFDGERVTVLGAYSESQEVPLGAELVSINGKPMEDIVSVMRQAFFSDGNNETFKYLEMGRYFSAYYANLFEGPEYFTLVCEGRDGLLEVKVPAISHEEVEDFQNLERESEESKPPYSLEFISDRTALLTIRSFWREAKGRSYNKFLKEAFQDLRERNTQNLVIDLRDNEGGIDKRGARLMSYLTDQEFGYYDRLEVASRKKFSFAGNAQLPKFYGLMRMFISKDGNGKYRWKHNKNLKVQKPRKDAFTGPTYVLINGASFSVTAEFAAVAHHLKRATFVGEETGGGYYGNNSGVFALVTLPNSRLTVGIPLIAYYLKVDGYPYPDRGVIPDYEVRPTSGDLLMGKDPVLDFTLGQISKSKD
jgi:hypothetical protein